MSSSNNNEFQKMQLEIERLKNELETHNMAAAHGLDCLWRSLILARKPEYGDWEYPGQAFRHLDEEFREVLRENYKAKKRIKVLEEALNPFALMHREGTDPSECACQRGIASDLTMITSRDFARAAESLKSDNQAVVNNQESWDAWVGNKDTESTNKEK
jgi:hypothetical protein